MLVAEGLSSAYVRESWGNKRHFRSNGSRSPRSAVRCVIALNEDTDDPRHDERAQERTRLTDEGTRRRRDRAAIGGSEWVGNFRQRAHFLKTLKEHERRYIKHQETFLSQCSTMAAILQPLRHCDSPITEFPIAPPQSSIVQYSTL